MSSLAKSQAVSDEADFNCLAVDPIVEPTGVELFAAARTRVGQLVKRGEQLCWVALNQINRRSNGIGGTVQPTSSASNPSE